MAVLFGIAGDVGSFSEEAAFLYSKRKDLTLSLLIYWIWKEYSMLLKME